MTAPTLSHPDILDPDAPDTLLDILRAGLHEAERARCHMGPGMARGHLASAVWHLRHAMMSEDPNALGCVNPDFTCSLCAPRVRPSLFDSAFSFGMGVWPVREVVAPVNARYICAEDGHDYEGELDGGRCVRCYAAEPTCPSDDFAPVGEFPAFDPAWAVEADSERRHEVSREDWLRYEAGLS